MNDKIYPYTVAVFDDEGNETYMMFPVDWAPKIRDHWTIDSSPSFDKREYALLQSYFEDVTFVSEQIDKAKGDIQRRVLRFKCRGISFGVCSHYPDGHTTVWKGDPSQTLAAMPHDPYVHIYVVVLLLMSGGDPQEFKKMLLAETSDVIETGNTSQSELNERMVWLGGKHRLVTESFLRRVKGTVPNARGFFEGLTNTTEFEALYGNWIYGRGWKVSHADMVFPFFIVETPTQVSLTSDKPNLCAYQVRQEAEVIFAAQSVQMAFFLTGLSYIAKGDDSVFGELFLKELAE